MKPEAARFLEKAERAIRAAKNLLATSDTEFAAGRAYYAMFYTAEALLAQRDLRFRKHSGVHAAFGQHLAGAHLVDPKFHRWLLEAFNQRILGDYGIDVVISPSDVEQMIRVQRSFFGWAESIWRHLPEHLVGERRVGLPQLHQSAVPGASAACINQSRLMWKRLSSIRRGSAT